LAEWLLFIAPIAFAFSYQRICTGGAFKSLWSCLLVLIALLTFARSAWITFLAELLLVAPRSGGQSPNVRCSIWIGLFFFSPLAIYMPFFSARAEVLNRCSRVLTGIALELFQQVH
jgi:hypothetical protein